MSSSQDTTPGSRGGDHRRGGSASARRGRPESSSTSHSRIAICDPKKLKLDQFAFVVEISTGGESEIVMIEDHVTKQSIKIKDEINRQSITIRDEITKQSVRAERSSTRPEKKPRDLHSVISKLRKERDHLKNRQHHSKSHEKMVLGKMLEMSKEVQTLRNLIDAGQAPSRDCYSDKVLLEQQLHALQARVDGMQPLKAELDAVKGRVAAIEGCFEGAQLIYPQVIEITNACVVNSSCDGVNINATAPSFQPEPQFVQLVEEMMPVRENKVYTVPKDPNGPIQRLQKKLDTVTQERDTYLEILKRFRIEKVGEDMIVKYDGKGLTFEKPDIQTESIRVEAMQMREKYISVQRENAELIAERDALLAANQKRDQSQTKSKGHKMRDGNGSGSGSEKARHHSRK